VNHITACCQHNHTAHAAAIFCRLSNQARAINNARDLIANPANWIWAQKYQQKYGGKRSALLCATAIYHSHHNTNLDALTPVAYTTRTKHAYTTPPLTKTTSPSAHACSSPDLRNMINGEVFWMKNWYVDKDMMESVEAATATIPK
jgi:hypothetical protein